MRVRSVSAHELPYRPCKTEDILACLRGAVSGGAEKTKDRELPDKFYKFIL